MALNGVGQRGGRGGCVWVCVGRQEGMAWHGTMRSPGWLLTGAHRRGCPAFGADYASRAETSTTLRRRMYHR